MYDLLFVDKIVTHKKDDNIKGCIKPSTGSIPKGLKRQQPLKKRVEEINNSQDQCTHSTWLIKKTEAKIGA